MAATFDPTHAGANIVFSNGNLTVHNTTTSFESVLTTATPQTSGSWYYEATIASPSGNSLIGVGGTSLPLTDFLGQDAPGQSCGAQTNTSNIFYGGSRVGTAPLINTTNPTVGVAVNLSLKLIWFTINGTTWLPSGSPAAGTGGISLSALTSAVTPAASINSADTWTGNFSGPFAFTVPSGFSAWPAPATASASQRFLPCGLI